MECNFSKELWAWQFLRRNPEYQQDYRHFIQTWKALVQDYGAPPNRDFTRWKRDPRSYILADEASIDREAQSISCEVEPGKIQIECAMGAKWGFYKFPLAPEVVSPKYPDELLWREREPLYINQPIANEVAETIIFDLAKPLDKQLQQAKKCLAVQRRKKKDVVKKYQLKNQIQRWKRYCTILDMLAEGMDEARVRQQQGVSAAEIAQAKWMRQNYLTCLDVF